MRAKSKLEVRIRSEARVCSELCFNKTPTQALTPPAKKIGKSLTYV